MIIPSTKIPGKETEREHNFSLIKISYEALAKLLEIPTGSCIVSLSDDFDNNAITIKIKGFGKGPSSQGLPVPELAMVENGWMA